MPNAQYSAEAYERMEAELARLRAQDKPAAEAALAAARGDSSSSVENYAAVEAVNDLRRLEKRIASLAAELAGAEIIVGGSGDVVAVGTVVELDMDGARWELLVGSIREQSDTIDVVSPDSPLGQALLGTSAGDEVSWSARSGRQRATVIALRA